MPSTNDKIQDAGFVYATKLERASATQVQEIFGLLDSLSVDLRAKIIADDLEAIAAGKSDLVRLTDRRRLRREAAIANAQATIKEAYAEIKKKSRAQISTIARLANKETVKFLDELITPGIFEPLMTSTELKTLVGRTLVEGKHVKDWWEDQDAKTQDAFAREMRIGIAAGESNDSLVTRVIGKSTGRALTILKDGKPVKVQEYVGGVMGISRQAAVALVRTSAQSVSNEVLLETYRENEDILKGVATTVTLDSRTTLTCIARDGASWDMQGNPLPDSSRQEPFPGPPPWHWQCRTVLTPITKSWDDLRKDAGLPARKRKALDTIPDSERASIDGNVSGKLSYEDWLRGKSVKYQKRVLGPERQKLWEGGKIKAAQLTDFSGNPLTLEELEKLIA
jgi:hypothetical protein